MMYDIENLGHEIPEFYPADSPVPQPEPVPAQPVALTPNPIPPEMQTTEVTFLIFAKDKEKLNDFMTMAYRMHLIKQQTVNDFMAFCMDCAAGYILDEAKKFK
jgi:hypothetical protein